MDPLTPSPSGSTGWVAENADSPFDTSDWNERLAILYAHWRKIRPEAGLLPGRQHFDPVDLPRLLGSIWMLDVLREPFRLKYRLVGTNIVTVLGGDFTGRWYDEARPAVLKGAQGYERYHCMADRKLATWRRGKPIRQMLPHWHTTENLMMPMAQDGRNVDLLLCASIYYGHSGRVL